MLLYTMYQHTPLLTIAMYTTLYTTHVPCLVAIVNYTLVQEIKKISTFHVVSILSVPMLGQPQPPFKDLVTVALENFTS